MVEQQNCFPSASILVVKALLILGNTNIQVL